MITLRPARERGHANHGWLDTWHSFSFANYYDPKHMGFRSLRVINDDRVDPAMGFGMHGHTDMEIITWVLDGALEHRDSMGTRSVLRPGFSQVMSAGTGVRHSEMNPSPAEPVRLLQIWIEPARAGVKPTYGEREIPVAARRDRLAVIASGDGRDGSLRINQDAVVYAGLIAPGKHLTLSVSTGRHAWIQMARGGITVNGKPLGEGDGAAISDESVLELVGVQEAEVLVFDLA